MHATKNLVPKSDGWAGNVRRASKYKVSGKGTKESPVKFLLTGEQTTNGERPMEGAPPNKLTHPHKHVKVTLKESAL